MTHHITRHKKLFGNHQNFLSLFLFFAINKFKNYFIKKTIDQYTIIEIIFIVGFIIAEVLYDIINYGIVELISYICQNRKLEKSPKLNSF